VNLLRKEGGSGAKGAGAGVAQQGGAARLMQGRFGGPARQGAAGTAGGTPLGTPGGFVQGQEAFLQRSLSAPPAEQPFGAGPGILARNVSGAGAFDVRQQPQAGVPYDMSDFPALGLGSGGGGASGGGIQGSYAMHIGQGGPQGQQRQQIDFNIQSEDFPALGGSSGPQRTGNASVGGGGYFGQQMMQQQPTQQHEQQRINPQQQQQTQDANHFGKPGSTFLKPLPKMDPGQSKRSYGDGGLGPKKGVAPSKRRLPPHEHFGLLGLLSVIRMEDQDRSTLALGTDLTTLGLNLNSSDSLHTSFSSPWSDRPSRREPSYKVPQCYNAVKGPGRGVTARISPEKEHFVRYKPETLFYIFYAMPKDVAQILAAQELYNRDWKFHVEHKVWFTQSPKELSPLQQPQQQQLPAGTPHFVYFDIQAWERRLFTNTALANNLQSGFMDRQTLFSIASNSS